MATLEQIKAKGAALARDLQEIEAEIKASRTELQRVVTNPAQAEQAAKLAAGLMVLEAREKATAAALEANRREQERRAELVKTKEYKDAQKRITELTAEIKQEAADVAQAFAALRGRVAVDMQKHDELCHLIRAYCVDMEEPEKNARMQTEEYGYLFDVHIMLQQRHEVEKRAKYWKSQSAALTEARKNKKANPAQAQPGKVLDRVTRAFYRYTDSKGNPELDAAGNPIG